MACVSPLKGWPSAMPTQNGKFPICFDFSKANIHADPLQVPCGQCVGCRLERSRQWAIRCVHEMRQHSANSFITLTFDDAHMDSALSLRKHHFQLFMKRLRKNTGEKIRYFHCGEYGENTHRPHHHAIIFGYDFPDKKHYKGNLYDSAMLQKCWQDQGQCLIGEANFETAAYVARYVLKKVTGPDALQHYEDRLPEFVTMSRRPGIGQTHFEKYQQSIYDFDEVIMREKPMLPPKYYDRQLEKIDPELLKSIKESRKHRFSKELTGFQLYQKKACIDARLRLSSRSLE